MASSRWQEFLAALAAGARTIPLGDNTQVYQELIEKLRTIRTQTLSPPLRPVSGRQPDLSR